MRIPAAAVLLALLANLAVAQPAGYDASSSDSMTSAALRASLLGDAEGVRQMALDRLEWESGRRVKEDFVISERLAILAESSRRWLPSHRQARAEMRGFPRTDATAAFRENLKASEPREVLRNATATRVYESRRRVVNSVIGALAGVLQLQFFGLVQLPLDAAESMVSGRPFVNPEQRRELRAARVVLQDRPRHAEAARLVQRYESRRVRLAAEHAEANAERALDQGRLETAAWWVQWAETVSGGTWSPSGRLTQLPDTMAEQEESRTHSIFVREVATDDREEAWLRWVLASLDGPAEAQGRTPLRDLRGEELGADVRAAIIAVRREPANPPATLQALDAIARANHPAWSPRAQGYLDALAFDPAGRTARARGDLRGERRDFVLWATDPTIGTSAITPETARLAESQWITAARSLFVIDMLGRLITLPLLPPGTFPRDGVLQATASAPPEYLDTDSGDRVLRTQARALSRMGRHAQAATVWERVGDAGRAQTSRERAARRLERLARETTSPAQKAAILQRVVAGWPDTPAHRRSVPRLAQVEEEMAVLTEVSRDELRALAPAWVGAGWSSPGEDRRAMARLMEDGTVQWRATQRGEWVATPVAEETFDQMVASLRELRLGGRVSKALDEPLERKRIPLLLDASAGPGVDFTPGLVPADIPTAQRRLYE